MAGLYRNDLAFIHAAAFETLARGAAPEIVRRLRTAQVEIRRVLDVGCGAGPLTSLLAGEGFEVTAIDPSTDLLNMARIAAPASRFVNASIYDIPIESCEAVIAVGEPLTYHETPDADLQVRRFFDRVSDRLPRGGILIFDVIETGEPSLAGRSWMSGADWAVLVETSELSAEKTLLRNIETFRRVGEHYRRGYELHRVRLFDVDALCADLVVRGFTVETARSYGSHPLPPRRRAFFAVKS